MRAELAAKESNPVCKRHKWTAVPGTQKQKAVIGAGRLRAMRYALVQKFKCANCESTEYKAVLPI